MPGICKSSTKTTKYCIGIMKHNNHFSCYMIKLVINGLQSDNNWIIGNIEIYCLGLIMMWRIISILKLGKV